MVIKASVSRRDLRRRRLDPYKSHTTTTSYISGLHSYTVNIARGALFQIAPGLPILEVLLTWLSPPFRIPRSRSE